jgi:2,5-diketo-D-gluconate reductase A
MTNQVPELKLSDSGTIPPLGFGVFEVPPEKTADAVSHALSTGYRLIDTAAAYGNEAQVGEAIRSSGLDREDVFVTTKVWNSDHGHDQARRAFERSLDQLGFDYVDLYLIHWPVPSRDLYVETWQALVELHQERRARSIGVSNFEIPHLERIIEETGVTPSVDQVELHPQLQQARLREFNARQAIVTEAWSPLGRGALLDDPLISDIAEELGRTPAQVLLRWQIELGNVALPRSVTPARIEENFNIFDFELGPERMSRIAELDAGERVGPDPNQFAVA